MNVVQRMSSRDVIEAGRVVCDATVQMPNGVWYSGPVWRVRSVLYVAYRKAAYVVEWDANAAMFVVVD